MLSDHGLFPQHVGSFIKLLSNFEIAVPLDANTLLIPSLIANEADKCINSTVTYTFPRQNVKKHSSKDLNVQASIYASKVLPAVAGIVHAKRQLTLYSTGVCYRRIVLLHHIPISFWPRLLARCLSSASQFYKIILNNCVPDMPFQQLANPGDVVIGHIPCQWCYWKTGIMLDFDNRTLLYVSNLVNPNVIDDDGNRQASSSTVEKIRKMELCPTGKDWQQNFSAFNNGFEINVPDYILESRSTDPEGPKRISSLMSAQIMSHVLEVIDEVLREWFKGDSGLYTDDNTIIQQFVPCPYCFGDTKLSVMPEDNSLELTVSIPHQPVIDIKIPNTWVNNCLEEETDLFKGFPEHGSGKSMNSTSWNPGAGIPAGFTFKHGIWAANNTDTIGCPHHNALELSDLIPDVVRCVFC